MDEGKLKALLEPLKRDHFVKEHRYQLTHMSAFNRLMCSLEALYAQAEAQILSLEQEIAFYKLEAEK